MARVSGVDIPDEKRVDIALRYLYGIGPTRAQAIIAKTRVNPATRVKNLSETELTRIREVIEKEYTVEGDLRREIRQNIQRLIDINCYRGQRHRRNLPVRGQRTRTNARTRRGTRKTVAGRRKATRK